MTDGTDGTIRVRGESPWRQYRPGAEGGLGVQISEVLHCTHECIVYIGIDDSVYAEANTSDNDKKRLWSVAIDESDALAVELRHFVRDRRSVQQGLRLLGAALATQLATSSSQQTLDVFGGVRAYIDVRRRETLQIYYFVAASATTAALLLALLLLPVLTREAQRFLICASTGALGALVSVSQRLRSIAIERYSSRLYTSIGGASRIVFGGVFGAVLLLFQEAGLLLAIVATNIKLSAAAAFVAGFSERLLPDLLARFEKQFENGTGRGPDAPAA